MSLSLIDLTRLAFISLRAKPFRSSLTALGIFMGVIAVSVPLQVRNISSAVLTREMKKREAAHALIYPRSNQVTGIVAKFKMTDLEFLKAKLNGLRAISSSVQGRSDKIFFQDQELQTQTLGVTEEFLETTGREIIKGRFFTKSDFNNYRSVVVIDEFTEKELFKGEDPISQRIYFQNRLYFIIGVVQQRQQFFRQEPQGLLIMPITTKTILTGRQEIDNILLRPNDDKNLETLGNEAVKLLKERYPGIEFLASSNIVDVQFMNRVSTVVSVVLVILGSIALAVGGVGITNITIASVLERTQEIGLRRALGATRSDILFQFLLEAALISLLGGTMALITVHGVTVIVSSVFNLPYEFFPSIAITAVGSALFVGLGAGFIPANRASLLDPVKAL